MRLKVLTEIAGVLGVALVLVGAPAAVGFYQASLRSSDPTAITLAGSAPESGSWDLKTLRVRLGERVKLRLTSNDISHGFAIPELGVESGLIHPGKFTTLEFVPTKAGTFEYVCTVVCSPKHGEMRGRIIVEWDPAAASPEKTEAGRRVFDAQGCARCHSVGGQGGTVAPDLSRVGARRDPQYFRDHLRNPQEVQPGTIMPRFLLSGDEIEDLTEYLLSLR